MCLTGEKLGTFLGTTCDRHMTPPWQTINKTATHSWPNILTRISSSTIFCRKINRGKLIFAQNWPLNDWNVTNLCSYVFYELPICPFKNRWEYLPMHIVNLWSVVTHRPGVWEAPSRAPPKNVTIGFNFPLRVNSIFHACCKIFYSRKAGLIFIAKVAVSRKNSPSTSWACHDLPWPGLGVTH